MICRDCYYRNKLVPLEPEEDSDEQADGIWYCCPRCQNRVYVEKVRE